MSNRKTRRQHSAPPQQLQQPLPERCSGRRRLSSSRLLLRRTKQTLDGLMATLEKERNRGVLAFYYWTSDIAPNVGSGGHLSL